MYHHTYLTVFFIILVTSCIFLFWCDLSYSNSLPLPKSAQTIADKISDLCEECLKEGFSPTGTDKIGFGKDFYPNFFLGNPKAGILITHVMTGTDYKALIRENEYENARNALLQKFTGAKLLVIKQDSLTVHISSKPNRVEVILTEELHNCLYGTSKPICCCCTTSCEEECCEKKLGSTYVLVRWKDPLDPERTIEHKYSPHPGDSIVYDVDESGIKKDMRWSLGPFKPGFLK